MTPVDNAVPAAGITTRVWRSSTDSVTWVTLADVGATITKSPAVTTYYRAIFGTAGGCKDSVDAKIIVSPIPTISTISSPAAVCVGGTIDPTNPTVTSNSATINSQSWQMETGVASNTYNVLLRSLIPLLLEINGKRIRYRVTTTCT